MVVLFIGLFLLVVVLSAIYALCTWKYNFWKKRNVPHLQPVPLFGNYKEYITLKKPHFIVADEICKQFADEPYIGTYYGTEPALLIKDPELIKLITTKDFGSFSGREISKYTDLDTISRNMFLTYGDKWKVIRQNTSPMFTTSKLKKMFPLILNCIREFENLLEQELKISNILRTRSFFARYTLDVIGSIGFGIDSKVMDSKTENNAFRKMGDLIFENSNLRGIALVARAMWPAIFYGVGLTVLPKRIKEFFHNLIVAVFKERNYLPSKRNDFIDLMLNLKQNDYLTCESVFKSKKGETVRVKVDDEFLVAQIVLFFAAGFETSSSTLSYTLYQLAKDQNVQKRVHAEIDEYLRKRNGNIEFDCLTELPYLEACVDETMRLTPILGVLTREVLESYELPSGLKLEPGLRIHLPVYHLHHHPKYFPEPEKFNPERFLMENKENIRQYTYMPFGEGQRICIGMRVARMQMYPGLITVLRKYRVEFAKNTPEVLDFEPRVVPTQVKEEIQLKLIPREETIC